MKKILLYVAICFGFASCDSNDNNGTLPVDGQYVAQTGDMLFSMQLYKGKCLCFTMFDSGYYFAQSFSVSTSGDYPEYEYTAKGLTIRVKFTDVDIFNAKLSGGASSVDGTHWVIAGSFTVTFRLDDRVLDANGDGVLDSWQ